MLSIQYSAVCSFGVNGPPGIFFKWEESYRIRACRWDGFRHMSFLTSRPTTLSIVDQFVLVWARSALHCWSLNPRSLTSSQDECVLYLCSHSAIVIILKKVCKGRSERNTRERVLQLATSERTIMKERTAFLPPLVLWITTWKGDTQMRKIPG